MEAVEAVAADEYTVPSSVDIFPAGELAPVVQLAAGVRAEHFAVTKADARATTRLVDRVRYDLTGKLLDEMPEAEFRDLTRRSFTRVATGCEPLHAQRERILDGRMRRYETIIMPLSGDGAVVDALVCGLIYDGDR